MIGEGRKVRCFVSAVQVMMLLKTLLIAKECVGFSCWSRPTIAPNYQHEGSLFVSRKNKNDDMPSSTATVAPNDEAKTNAPIFASSAPTTQTKKKKKNKYAQFSKVDKSNDHSTQSSSVEPPLPEDPLEALIRESEAKLKQLQQEQEAAQMAKKRPKVEPIINPNKRLNFPNNKDIDPYDPTTFGYIEIGTVLGAHGVHGWAKVQGCTDFPERLTTSGMVLHFKPFRKRAPRQALLVNGKCTGADSYLIQLQDCYDRASAEKLKGGTLYYATQQDTVKQKDDLLLSDLVGFQVVLLKDNDDDPNKKEEGGEQIVGTVGGIVLAEEMCAIPGLGQDMLEVIVEKHREATDALSKPGTSKDLVLIPMVPEIVPKVDLKAQRVWIDPPAGLLDLTYVREEKVRIKGLLPPAKE